MLSDLSAWKSFHKNIFFCYEPQDRGITSPDSDSCRPLPSPLPPGQRQEPPPYRPANIRKKDTPPPPPPKAAAVAASAASTKRQGPLPLWLAEMLLLASIAGFGESYGRVWHVSVTQC